MGIEQWFKPGFYIRIIWEILQNKSAQALVQTFGAGETPEWFYI